MYITSILTVAASSLVMVALAGTCNQDNCYRALEHYQETTSSSFCKQYLKTSTKTAPSGIATCGSSRISSACSCLTTTTPPPITTTSSASTSTFDTSTCTQKSIPACPTAYDPCCAFICGEALVPFPVCSPNNRTVLAQCSQCSYAPTTTPIPLVPSKKTTSSAPKTTTKSTAMTTTATSKTTLSSVTTTAPASFPFPTSTCTGRLLSIAGCPTPYDHCCQYVCEEAQVPYDVCSLTNGSGEYASCSSCPSPTPT